MYNDEQRPPEKPDGREGENDMPITFAICGCGSRGLEAYASYQKVHPEEMPTSTPSILPTCRPAAKASAPDTGMISS